MFIYLCQFCKQYRKQHNNNCFIPTKLTTKDGEQAIKKAAQISNPKLYLEIKDVLTLLQKSLVIILSHVK